jgi:nicotinate-nucleotide adenylyltransferase
MRIGIFGGTFDPPHLGHLILAAEAYHQLKLDKLLFVLTSNPPHKQDHLISPYPHRLAMLEAAIADNPTFALSRLEIDRPGPHYSVDTMRLLKKEFPDNTLIYLMGGDSLHDLPTIWHKPDEFIQACDVLGVMRRPEDKIDMESLETELPGVSAKVEFMNAPLLEIASQQIRQRVAEGRPYRYYLPDTVYQIIQKKKLYQSN